jgi:hypothetical protein
MRCYVALCYIRLRAALLRYTPLWQLLAHVEFYLAPHLLGRSFCCRIQPAQLLCATMSTGPHVSDGSAACIGQHSPGALASVTRNMGISPQDHVVGTYAALHCAMSSFAAQGCAAMHYAVLCRPMLR